MNFDLDKLAADIQKEIWSQFSDVFMDHAKNPRNIGRIEKADGYGCVTGLCGDTREAAAIPDTHVAAARKDAKNRTVLQAKAAAKDNFTSRETPPGT